MQIYPPLPTRHDVRMEQMPSDTKERINVLLYGSLPGHLTLQRMEQWACHIHDCIVEAWNEQSAPSAYQEAPMNPQATWHEITGLLACNQQKELKNWQRRELVQALKDLIFCIEQGTYLPQLEPSTPAPDGA